MGTLGKVIYTVGRWIRGTGQAIDRLGTTLQGGHYIQENCMRPNSPRLLHPILSSISSLNAYLYALYNLIVSLLDPCLS